MKTGAQTLETIDTDLKFSFEMVVIQIERPPFVVKVSLFTELSSVGETGAK